ncbi:MAG: hypothetical protein ACK5QT_04495 [Oligoflexia bacterium]|jgi:hypothetical protein
MGAYSVRKKETKVENNQKVEVLYQRIGSKWYAFSEENNEVFFTEVPEDVLSGSNSPNSGSDLGNS